MTIVTEASVITEGGDAVFTLTRTTTSGALSVNVNIMQEGNYAVNTNDIGMQTVNFTAGSVTASLTIATENDEADEENGSITATIEDGTGYSVGASSSAEVAVTDDDEEMTVGLSDESGAVLYPNPVERYLYVRLPDGGRVSVYTVVGRLEHVYSIEPSKEVISLDVSDIPSGAYVIMLTDVVGRSSYYRVVKR